MFQYALETLAECQTEVDHVLRTEHWPEVGHYKDIPIDMNWELYAEIEKQGRLRCYTVRSPLNETFVQAELIGYAFYLIAPHLHYRKTLVASQDILYVRKPYRGFGIEFIDWCDSNARREGAVTVTQHVKPWGDFSEKLCRELGYHKAETIYSRRLD